MTERTDLLTSPLLTSKGRRALLFSLATAVVGSLLPMAATAQDDAVWTMITDQNGLGDHGFNDLAKLGLDRSVEAFGGRAQVIQSTDQSQFVPNLLQAVAGGSTMVVGVGSLLNDALTEVAMMKPEAHFTLIDAVSVDDDGKPLENVASVTFREQEAAFLAGVVAAMTSKTGHIGFVGGMETPPVVRFLAGYKAGIATVDPEIKISHAFVGSFRDPAKAKVLAEGMFDSDVDVIMDVAGGGGRGIYDAITEAGADHWVIAADTCKGHLAPDNFLTSAVKDVAGAVFYENKAVHDETFEGGPQSLGLAEGAVGLCADNIDTLPAEVLAKVEAAKAKIIAGELTPPDTYEALDAFAPGEL
ncbi:BMP family lipoprotein [Celeribacter neptunius]|uniref:Basic membrane protein A n=1 Tax=Celeribacter neptunius TaxID=588602 RepID=A0A1I3VTC0_9RHOB|nr:BMP family ABC transporter substrate-binding protein [Celeribacter neptunius]SFJ97526.1 basic membrane protein A [Celeribacter neptunius]